MLRTRPVTRWLVATVLWTGSWTEGSAVLRVSPVFAGELTFLYRGKGIEAQGLLKIGDRLGDDKARPILSICGKRNGIPITGLWPSGQAIPLNDGYPIDNLVFLHHPFLTGHGFGFTLADGTFANPFFADFTQPASAVEYFSNPSEPGPSQTLEGPITFLVMAVEERSPMVPLAALIAGLVLVAFRSLRLQRSH